MQVEEIFLILKLSLSDLKVLESVARLSEHKLRQKVEGVPEQQVFKGCRFCRGKSKHGKLGNSVLFWSRCNGADGDKSTGFVVYKHVTVCSR